MSLRDRTIILLTFMHNLGLSRSARDQVLERLAVAMDGRCLREEVDFMISLMEQSSSEEELLEMLNA